MKRVLLDQGLSPSAAELLNRDGWDAVHVFDVGLSGASDLDVISYAQRTGRACVTLDHDFHAHLAMLRSAAPSVVLLRIEGLKAAAQVVLVRSVWEACEKDLDLGAAVSVDAKAVRDADYPCAEAA